MDGVTYRIALTTGLLAVAHAANAAPASVQVIGSYANMSEIAGDVVGYSVDLYRQGDIVFGRLCEGAGDGGACGRLEDVKLDPAIGVISFNARVCDTPPSAPVLCAGEDRQTVTFNGRIKPHSLSGNWVRHWSAINLTEEERVKLKRAPDKPDNIPASYSAWLADPSQARAW